MKRVMATTLAIAARPAFFLIAAFVAVIVLGSGSAYCFELRDVPEISDPGGMSEEEFLERTRLIELSPENDPFLAFKIRIPKTWDSSDDIGLRNYLISRKVVGEVARYYSPPRLDLRSSVSISAMQMEHKITAKNWFIYQVFTQGFTLEGMKVISDEHIIAQYVLIEDDVAYRVRAAAVATGRRVVMAQYYVPLENSDKEEALQAKVIDTFELTNPEDDLYFASDTYSFLDLIEFDYPLTWQLRTPLIRDIERMEARIVNVLGETQLNGQIDLYLFSHNNPTLDIREEVVAIKDEFLQKSRFEFGNLLETIDDFNYDADIDTSIVEVYQLQSDKRMIGYEYWFALLDDSDFYYYIVIMVTPARTADFYTWAQNIEIFQYVVESIKHGGSSF